MGPLTRIFRLCRLWLARYNLRTLNANLLRWIAAVLATTLALCASACAVPLAPGYKIVKESRKVRFVPGSPAALEVRATFTMRNSGTAELAFVDVILPAEQAYGRTNLRVQVDGHDATVTKLPVDEQPAHADAMRIALDPGWGKRESREISVEYTLRSPENYGARVTIGDDNFHLSSRGWYPEFQAPKRVLAPTPVSPKVVAFSVRVPADFVLLASGISKGQKKSGDEVEHSFDLETATMGAYVVAGKYSAWPAQRKSSGPILWTLAPLKDDPSMGAQQIGSVWDALEKDFGPLDKSIAEPHIVEAPGLRGRLSGEEAPAAVAFPAGAIVNPAALGLGTGSEDFLRIVSHALAQEWFGESMYLSDAAAVGMGEGLPEYATVVIDEARNGPDARKKRVSEYLRRYDEAAKLATETPLSAITLTDAAGPRRIALAKAPLFFVALEDVCGEGPMRTGLTRMLAAMRGREAGYADLRSALEQSCSRDFAPMFRLWLNSKGIPPDFRVRYQGSAVGESAQLGARAPDVTPIIPRRQREGDHFDR
jgi:hypothetical protein